MAVMQYNSGVVEDVKPKNLVFTDEELLQYFSSSSKLRSKRLMEIPNSWCLWGEDKNANENTYNRLGSRIAGEKIYTPLFVLHDSEINPDLYITDKIILTNYTQFRDDVLAHFDFIAIEILSEFNKHQNPNENFAGSGIAPQLNIIGPTSDKRALMEFNPHQQSKEFLEFNNFSVFASKSFGYLHQFFNNNLAVPDNSFAIYADNKTIIIVIDENVDDIMRMLLENFESREKFHGCSHIVAIGKKWKDYIKSDKKAMEDKWEDHVKKLDDKDE